MRKKIEGLIIEAIKSAVDAGELGSDYARTVSGGLAEAPKDSKNGDFSTTVALSLARHEGRPPREVAEFIKGRIKDPEGVLNRIEIAGPGFINFFLKGDSWFSVLREIERQGGGFGHSHAGGGRKMQVEFVSANPTGPLHIGHGRGAAVGDSLCRLLSFTGHDVRREFYINDYGTQVENLGESVYMRCRELMGDTEARLAFTPKRRETEDAEEGGARNFYLGEYVAELAKDFMEMPEFQTLPEDGKKRYCREEGVRRMLGQIEQTLAAFGVSFDTWYSERSLYDPENNLVKKAIDELAEKGLVFSEGGATWLQTTGFGDDKDRVLIRKNGQTTYFASDVAYHRNKFKRGFEEVIDVWGADHHGYIPRMKAAIAALGYDSARFRVLLVQIVNLMREGVPVKMSKRAGEFVTLREVMDEVGADACRFTFLLRRSDSHLDFDLDLVKRQSAENPVYYVQYAHARLCSVFRQAAEKGVALPPIEDVNMTRLDLPEETELIKALASFPELVEGAAAALEPHRLTYYLQGLAAQLHGYYFKRRIISDDLELTRARMYLVKAVRTVVATALRLLGVSAPESM